MGMSWCIYDLGNDNDLPVFPSMNEIIITTRCYAWVGPTDSVGDMSTGRWKRARGEEFSMTVTNELRDDPTRIIAAFNKVHNQSTSRFRFQAIKAEIYNTPFSTSMWELGLE